MKDVCQVVADTTPTEHVRTAYEDELYYVATIGDKMKNTTYSNLTRQFSIGSVNGIVYIFVAYVLKCNANFTTLKEIERGRHYR